MGTIRIRAVDGACEKDAAMLLYLQLTVLPSDIPSDSREGYWWVAFSGDLPVAFAGLRWSATDPSAGYLCRAGVLPSHRGRGLQRRLLLARERKAVRLGMTAVVSDTYDNPHSTNNLIAAGYKAFAHPFPYGADGTNYWRKPLPIK